MGYSKLVFLLPQIKQKGGDRMICIYDKKTTKGNFETNGLGILSEAISCYITEELNGDYSLIKSLDGYN